MARNEEKAAGLMNRWTKFTSEIGKKERGKRPYLATKCTDLADCQHWRGEILFTISRKVQEIQNEGLGEHMVGFVLANYSCAASTRDVTMFLVFLTHSLTHAHTHSLTHTP